jgi:hypothetical protein
LHFLFSLSLFKIQNDVYGNGVLSTKKNKKEGKGVNGMHGKKKKGIKGGNRQMVGMRKEEGRR